VPVTWSETLDALPESGWLRRYVGHGVKQTNAPAVYHMGIALALLGATTPLQFGASYAGTMRANNYVLLVGRSGHERKTTSLNIGVDILKEAASPLIGHYPGSPEGLVESLQKRPSQLIPMGEFGRFLSSAQKGYFEPAKTLITDIWDCLDEDTEILGEHGWKKKGEVQVGDLVWSLDTKKNKLVLTPVLAVGSRAVHPDEKMVRLKGHQHDIRTTEGHRFYIKYRDPKTGGKPSRKYLIKTGKDLTEHRSTFYLPFSAQPQNENPGVPLSDDELRLIAFYLPRGNGPGKRKKNGREKYSKWLDKDLHPDLLSMNAEQFDVFWKELLLEDGEQTEQEHEGRLWSVRKTFVDRLQHLAVILGHSTQYGTKVLPSGKTAYCLSVGSRHLVSTDPGDPRGMKPELLSPKAEEQVWCATTEQGTLVTRRNGKVVILGNCRPTERVKANNKVVRVENPRLSIGAACSIPYLEKHTLSEDWTGGFMGRWMVFYGHKEWDEPNPIGDKTDFAWLVEQLKQRAMIANAGWCVGLHQECMQRWNEWYIDVNNRTLPDNIVGIEARLDTICRKICLALSWDYGPATKPDPWEITLDILEPAIKMTELHLKSIIHLSEVIADHPDARLRRSILNAILRYRGQASLGEILGVLKMRKRPILEMLDALMTEGRVKRVPTTLGPVYEVVSSGF